MFNAAPSLGNLNPVHMHAVERADRWYLSRTVCGVRTPPCITVEKRHVY